MWSVNPRLLLIPVAVVAVAAAVVVGMAAVALLQRRARPSTDQFLNMCHRRVSSRTSSRNHSQCQMFSSRPPFPDNENGLLLSSSAAEHGSAAFFSILAMKAIVLKGAIKICLM